MDLLNSFLDNIDEGVITTDAEGTILLFNKLALENSKTLLSVKPLQYGDNLIHAASPNRQQIVRNILLEIKRERLPVKSFAQYTNLNGTTIYLELNYVPVTNEEGKLTYIHLFIRDVTQQKVFENKLTTMAADISNLIEKANAIIFMVDSRGYITEWNEHCTQVTGFEKDGVYGQRLVDVLLTEEEKPTFDLWMLRISNHESVGNNEISVRTKDGRTVIILMSSTPRTSSTGEIIGVVFVGQDVTELTGYRRSLEIKVEERTRELQRVLKQEKEVVEIKNRFVSIASHEFRTPLSSIEVSANFIKAHKKKISTNELNKKLDNIANQSQHMTRLLDDILTYGKSEAGKIQLVVTSFVLPDFISKIKEEVENSTKNTHVIKADFHSIPTKITTDEKLMRSILTNLLTNAIKFSPGKEQVYLTVEFTDQLIITVCDEGIGIPGDEKDKIFEPFIRGKDATAIQGTGLGLSIVKKAVELLNGTIAAISEVGIGTTFTITIPELQHES